MGFEQRNSVNEKCHGCKWLTAWNKRAFTCTNKYACTENNKFKSNEQ